MAIRTRTSGIMTMIAPEPVVVPVYVGPGDLVPGAMGWWGLRAYTSASIGSSAIRLRESGGNTESDFATIAGGGLNLAAITTFKGANNLFVVTLYDQSGNGYDVTQATAGQQPSFLLATLGTLPVMQFVNASSMILRNSSFGSAGHPNTVSSVFNQTFGSGIDGRLYHSDNGPSVFNDSQGGAANTIVLYSGSSSTAVVCSDATWHALQAVYDGASSTTLIDGASTTGLNVGSNGFNTTFAFGGHGTVDFVSYNGFATEIGAWGSAVSGGDQTLLESNQHAYWGF